MRTLKLATRSSRLALAQAGLVQSALEALGQTVELVEVTTRGDRDRTSPLTAIGGQGHVIGRGNQQISPRVLRAIGLERMRVVATKRKLGTLGGRPLLVDSGDPVLDDSVPDAIRVWAGYKEELLYPLGYAKDQDAPAGA